MVYTPTGRRVPLARAGRPIRRFWRRSQAEKMALAYQEAGYPVVVGDEPPRWAIRELGGTPPRVDHEPS
jgi:hypothetical protein